MIAMRMRSLVAALLFVACSSVTAAEPPLTAEDYYQAGEKSLKLRDFDTAEAWYALALLVDTDHYGANVGMAWINNEKAKYTKAYRFAGKAIMVNPMKAAGWRELGYAEYKLGELDEAEKSLAIAVSRGPLDESAERYLKTVRAAKASRDGLGGDK